MKIVNKHTRTLTHSLTHTHTQGTAGDDGDDIDVTMSRRIWANDNARHWRMEESVDRVWDSAHYSRLLLFIRCTCASLGFLCSPSFDCQIRCRPSFRPLDGIHVTMPAYLYKQTYTHITVFFLGRTLICQDKHIYMKGPLSLARSFW